MTRPSFSAHLLWAALFSVPGSSWGQTDPVCASKGNFILVKEAGGHTRNKKYRKGKPRQGLCECLGNCECLGRKIRLRAQGKLLLLSFP